MTTQQAKDIVAKIKHEKITPLTHVRLRWKSILFWIVWGLLMIIGAIGFSLIIINILDIRPAFFHYMGIGRYVRALVVTAPYMGLGLAMIALISGFLAIRKTRHGYRYSILFITSMSVLLIILIGFVVHITRVNDRIGAGMMEGGIPRHMVYPLEERWRNPDQGMIGGRVVTMAENEFVIEGLRGDRWVIMHDDATTFAPFFDVTVGAMIEVVGQKKDGNVFYAKFVGPFHRRMRQMRDDPPPTPMEERELNIRRDAIRYEELKTLSPDAEVAPVE